MKVTSAEANKIIRQLNAERDFLLQNENERIRFVAATCEDIESVRPEYGYGEIQCELEKLEHGIIQVKHALNIFNSTTIVPGFEMTVDSMLVYLPILTDRIDKLEQMRRYLPKVRCDSGNGHFIEYRYINYDLDRVAKDLDAAKEERAKAQLALDTLNNTVKFEID